MYENIREPPPPPGVVGGWGGVGESGEDLGGGGYSQFFYIRRLGPSIYSSPQKNIRNFKYPKKYLKF